MLDERRLSVLIRQHGIGKSKDDAPPAKLLSAFLPKAEESKLGRILVETTRLARDYERLNSSLKGFHYIAFAILMTTKFIQLALTTT